MALSYYLYRGKEKIKIGHEARVFTVIAPESHTRKALFAEGPLQSASIKPLFRNVYKIEAAPGQLEAAMGFLRSNAHHPAVCHHAYCLAGDEATRYYLTDQLTVQFHPHHSLAQREALLRKLGLRFIKAYDKAYEQCLVQVLSAAGANPLKVSCRMMDDALVARAEPNLVNRFEAQQPPSDPMFPQQWHLQYGEGLDLAPKAGINASGAWRMAKGSRQITIGIIDDGFDLSHPDLSGAGKIVPGRDFTAGDSTPAPESLNGDFHGTPCAGVALAEENGTGVVGAAPGCSFLPVRFPLTADDDTLYEIFEFAGRRAHILSCSWGPVPVYAPLPSLLSEQVSRLARSGGPDGKGCLIFFAAGNYNAPVADPGNTSFWWHHAETGRKETRGAILNGYAAHPDTVTVAASTSLNQKAGYSNWGKEITLCAPSDNWNPLNPQERWPGRSIWTTDNEAEGLGFSPGSRYTGYFGGTSSACPLAAGAAALVKSANPDLTALAVRSILTATADKIVDASTDPATGIRGGSYQEHGKSFWFGHGKVNAQRAVETALQGLPQQEPANGLAILAYQAESSRILLFNRSPNAINLKGYRIETPAGKDQLGAFELSPGQTVRVRLAQALLLTGNGQITLRSPDGDILDRQDTAAATAAKEGWWRLL